MGVSTEDGRGNITAYAGVRDNKQVLQRDRDYSACSLSANPTASFACGGSRHGASPATSTAAVADADDRPVRTGNDVPSLTIRDADRTTSARRITTSVRTRATARRDGSLRARRIADVYTQLMFTDYESVAQIAPGGNFFDTNTINCDNPLLSAQQAGDDRLRCDADDDCGTATDAFRCTSAGATSKAAAVSSASRTPRSAPCSAFAARSPRTGTTTRRCSTRQSVADQSANNYFHKTRLARALDVVDGSGHRRCRRAARSSTARDPNCVPYNLFTTGGVTPDALNYLQVPGLQQGKIEQEIYSGVDHRRPRRVRHQDADGHARASRWRSASRTATTRLTNVTDDPTSQDLLSGAGGATIGIVGRDQRDRPFTELRVPLVQDKPFADQLALDTRVSLLRLRPGHRPTPTSSVRTGRRCRTCASARSYQRAVRAPNIVELFTAQGFNLFDLPGDPCGAADQHGGEPRAMPASRAVCLRRCSTTRLAGRVWTARPASTTSCRAATPT